MLNFFKKSSINLFPFIEKHARFIESSLSKTLALNRTFPHVWKKEDVHLTIYWGKPIWLDEKNVYLWHKMVLKSSNSKKDLESILLELKLSPLHELGASSDIHYNEQSNIASCYINPDFPTGQII